MKSNPKLRRRARLQMILFALFQKHSARKEKFDGAEKSADDAVDFSRIRCPLCKWRPRATDRWFCADAPHPEFFFGGCGAVWNTFATGGVCPGCRHRWKWTACLRCAESSPHADWYVEKTNG